MFAEFRTRLLDARGHLGHIAAVIEQLNGTKSETPRRVATINSAMKQMQAVISHLAAVA